MSASRIETYRKQFHLLASKTGADRFLAWWLKELSTLVPAWLHAPGDETGHLILLEMDGTAALLKQSQQGKWLEAGRLERSGADSAAQKSAFLALLNKLGKRTDEVGISLAASHLLRKSLRLPAAVEENLAQALEFEMDRHTPFKSNQVYFDYKIIGRDAKTNQLEVQIVLAPRTVVDEMLALMKNWGASVQGVWPADELAALPPRANLLPQRQRAPGKSQLRRINLALAALAGILLLAALIIPVVQKRELAIRLVPLAERARQHAEAADILHRELAKRVAEYNYLPEKKQAAPATVAVLEELSRLLPDNTWVQQLDLKGKELQIQGETASSSQLIGLFEQSKMLRDASFKSPLTKTQIGERFQLAAEVKLPLPETAKPEVADAKSQQPALQLPASAPPPSSSVPAVSPKAPAASAVPPQPVAAAQPPSSVPAAASKVPPASTTLSRELKR